MASTLQQQSTTRKFIYFGLIVLLFTCSLLHRRRARGAPRQENLTPNPPAPPAPPPEKKNTPPAHPAPPQLQWPANPEMRSQAGFTYQLKTGTSDEAKTMRCLFALSCTPASER